MPHSVKYIPLQDVTPHKILFSAVNAMGTSDLFATVNKLRHRMRGKENELTGSWGKVHCEERHNLYFANVITVANSRWNEVDGLTDDRCWPQSKDSLFIRQVTGHMQVIMSETYEKCARNSVFKAWI